MVKSTNIPQNTDQSSNFYSASFDLNSCTKTKILIVDNNSIIREGLKACLQNEQYNFDISIAKTGKDSILEIVNKTPDVILLSSNLTDLNTLKIISSICNSNDHPNIIVMYYNTQSCHNLQKYIAAGATGIIEYTSSIEIYNEAIIAVNSGDKYYTPSISKTIIPTEEYNKHSEMVLNLTDRELEILKLITNGMSSKEIASQYNLSIRTVETHRQNIRKKTNLKGLKDLMKIARSLNLNKSFI